MLNNIKIESEFCFKDKQKQKITLGFYLCFFSRNLSSKIDGEGWKEYIISFLLILTLHAVLILQIC